MSRIRTVKPEFWISEQIMNCSHSARLLFIGLWNFCDDGGVHPANLRKLKAEVFPGDDVTLSDIEGWIKELIHQKLVVEFTAQYNGESCNFWFVTGWKHQRIDKPYLKYPNYQAQQKSATAPRPFDDHSQNIPRMVVEHSAQVVEGSGREKEGKGEEAPQASRAAPPMPVMASVIEAPATATRPTAPKAPKAPKPRKAPIPPDWTPAETTFALLEKHGITRRFAEDCVDEFRLYWQERGESRAGWEAAFVNNAQRQWEHQPALNTTHRHAPRSASPPHAMTPESARFESLLRNLNRPVIEGEIAHEIH